jgi:hypothetical protein
MDDPRHKVPRKGKGRWRSLEVESWGPKGRNPTPIARPTSLDLPEFLRPGTGALLPHWKLRKHPKPTDDPWDKVPRKGKGRWRSLEVESWGPKGRNPKLHSQRTPKINLAFMGESLRGKACGVNTILNYFCDQERGHGGKNLKRQERQDRDGAED